MSWSSPASIYWILERAFLLHSLFEPHCRPAFPFQQITVITTISYSKKKESDKIPQLHSVLLIEVLMLMKDER